MKLFKYIGLFSLVCFTFFYTEKVIDVSIMHDKVMIDIQEDKDNYYIPPKDVIIDDIYIIPGKIGKEVNEKRSYNEMKRLGFYDSSLLIFDDLYPNKSIYNNYDKSIVKGNIYNKNVSLVFIVNNRNLFNIISDIVRNKNVIMNFFIDESFLNNNIDLIKRDKNYYYNYGNNGIYSKDSIIIGNNIVNNKSNNKSLFCLFLEINSNSLNNCASNKMFSIMPSFNGSYNNVKDKIDNGSIILINNSYELSNIIDYINSKGYKMISLFELVSEK